MSDQDYKKLMSAASSEIQKLKAQLKALQHQQKEPIAIVGMGCRFPGNVKSPQMFWELLRDGVDGVVEVSNERGWSMEAFYDPDPSVKGKINTRAMGMVSEVDLFDAEFFGIAPKEAERLDPQQRLLLEVTWETLEMAGIAPDRLAGSNTGVFLGASFADYATLQVAAGGMDEMSAYDGTGNALSVAAGRLSYFFGLHGPCMSIDTACSSSLVAISRAVQSLRAGECDAALSGGVSLILSPMNSIIFSTARMLSPEGRCKTFDADANGYVRGEGVGMVYLKRLSDALRDNDIIHALIRGVATNQDGRSQGITAPNERAQEMVIRKALENGGLDPHEVTYVEAHGTGTSLGDPIEMQAIGAAYCVQRDRSNPLWVGSAKTNLGHMETAAGVGGLIKTVLSLQHQQLPPHLHFHTPSPHIDWSSLPVNIPTQLTPWEGVAHNGNLKVRRGAVSSFGFGGSNAHIILEEAPAIAAVLPVPARTALTLSARNEDALRQLATRYADFLENDAAVLEDVCYTANTGRAGFDLRVALVPVDRNHAIQLLKAVAQHGVSAKETNLYVAQTERATLKTAWLFNGEGTPSTALAERFAEYREALQLVASTLPDVTNISLEDMTSASAEWAHVLGFAHGWALAGLWRSLGVTSTRMMGIGAGEYVVAALTGVFSLSEALRLLIASRGDASVFEAALAETHFQRARTQVIAAASGIASRDEIATADYWRKQGRTPFAEEAVFKTLQNAGINVYLEIGDGAAIQQQGARHLTDMLQVSAVSANAQAVESTLLAVAMIWGAGISVDWATLEQGFARRRIELPTYPFQRKRYWAKNTVAPTGQSQLFSAFRTENGDAATVRAAASNWYYNLSWHSQALNELQAAPLQVVILLDGGGRLQTLCDLYRQQGVNVITAEVGDQFAVRENAITFNRLDSAQWQQFWAHVRQCALPTTHIVWGGALDTKEAAPTETALANVLQTTLLLAQSLARAGWNVTPRLWVVTQQALAVDIPAGELALVQGTLAGLGRVMAFEMMDARVSRVDLDAQTSAAVLAQELCQTQFEDQVLYRNGERRVARLESLSLAPSPDDQIPVRAEKSYLITGGLGGLGLLFARWLAAQGARYLVLTGRSAPGTQAQTVIETLEASGVSITVIRADVSLKTDVTMLFERLQSLPPLGGVIHAAGVLDDGVIEQQTWERFQRVLAPKVAAGWWLHEATRGLASVEFFTLFSSVASSLGSPGQSNYAAANAYLDGLAAYRRTLGLPGQVINWGPWANAGMASTDKVRARLEKNSGFGTISEMAGTQSFAELLRAKPVHAIVVPIDWTQVRLATGILGQVPPVFSEQLQARGDGQSANISMRGGELLEQLRNARPNERHKVAIDYLREKVQLVMGLEAKPDIRLPMQELGMDSLMAVELRNVLSQAMGRTLPVAAMFDFPTVQKLAGYLADSIESTESTETVPAAEAATTETPAASAQEVLARVMASAEASRVFVAPPTESVTTPETLVSTQIPITSTVLAADAAIVPPQEVQMTPTQARAVAAGAEPIAVIGMACRFPGGAADPAGFWKMLIDGVDGVVELADKRWDMERFYDPDPQVGGKMYIRHGGLIDGVDLFDADFFSISPREATAMDPQQRLLLETSWHAIEAAGYTPEALTNRTPGVYVGIAPNDYSQQLYIHIDPKDINAHLGTGAHASMASGRLSYFLGWQGPCMTIDTACSSSLVAIHTASQALRTGECDAALAGGCNLTLSPLLNVTLCRAQMLSPDGHCKTFDASANGYVRSEGCGMLMLKRLSDAVADGDNILALIRGSAINQDGRSQGITAPNGPAQEAVIARALKNAGVTADSVDYVEAHGTGTRLGDPIEVLALNNTYGKAHSPDHPLVVGAVKSNIGHCEAAAGVAGVIKTILALQHAAIPANLNLKTLSPYLQYDTSRMGFAALMQPWPARVGKPKLAAVSSFGFSGSNSHAILQEAPPRSTIVNTVERPVHLIAISGRSPDARQQLAARYQAALPAAADTLSDIAFTANVGRMHHAFRAAVVAGDLDEATKRFAALAEGKKVPGTMSGQASDVEVAFLFSGQGSQVAGMARSLYEASPTFQRELDACRDALNPLLPLDLYSVFWGEHSAQLNQTQFTQPALFAVELALANTLRTWGIRPRVVMGHSVGEYAAACSAGVFSLQEGARLIAARGRLMQALPAGGKMCAIGAPADLVEPIVNQFAGKVSVAAYNTPVQTVISGDGDTVERLAQHFAGQGFEINRLDVSHAFHSPLMQPMLAEFAEVAASIRYQTPTLDVISNLTGQAERDRLCTPDYWVQHVFAPVRFAEGITRLATLNVGALVEIGPRPVLLGMARNSLTKAVSMLPTLRPGQNDWRILLQAIGDLYCLGVDVDWAAFDADYQRLRAVVPVYPFQSKRYWFEESGEGARALLGETFAVSSTTAGFALLGDRLHLPGSDEIRFETRYSEKRPSYVADHKLFGTVVVPGASHVSLFLSAAAHVVGGARARLTDTCFLQPIVLPDGEKRIVHTVLRKRGETQYVAELLSKGVDENADDAAVWITHASTVIETVVAKEPAAVPVNVHEAIVTWQNGITGADFYQEFDEKGYNLGESFRWLADAWQREGIQIAVWKMRWPQLPDNPADYRLYPSLIDACFQSLAGCDVEGNERNNGDEIYIPFSVAELRLFATPTPGVSLWVHASLRPREGDDRRSTTGDILLFTEQGEMIAELIGVESRLASRAALSSNLRKDLLKDCMYELQWKPQSAELQDALPAGEWLLFAEGNVADGNGVGKALCTLLQERDISTRLITPTDLADVTDADALQALLESWYPLGKGCAGIVHLWALNSEGDVADWAVRQRMITGSAMALMRALARIGWRQIPHVWWATQAAQTPFAQGTVDPHQTAQWGLNRVFALEHFEFSSMRVDLDPAEPASTAAARLLQELNSGSSREDQVLYRDGSRYVARLQRSKPVRNALGAAQALTVKVPAGGLLDKLAPTIVDRREPGAGEVEIEVRAAALNFRDVLNALGMFREYAEAMGINLSEFPLGFDCAGVVTKVGAGVTNVVPGDAVVAGAYNALSTHVIAHSAWVHKKPAQLSFEQAAAIPTVFMTAWHALAVLAQVKPGDKVLIHAAAGGVGQAAMQVALSLGADVYATASPGKWAYLLGKGVKGVFNSRVADFADGLLAMTGGHGVDVVLNSFNGDFIPETLKALASNGRFVEIGKIGVWTQAQMTSARPDVQYALFDVAEATRTSDFKTYLGAFAEVMARYESRLLQALPVQVFGLDQVVDAFRHLQSGRNVGKVVVSMPVRNADHMPIRNDRSYLITGGLGSLGMRVAGWLIERGARYLVLSTRSAPSDVTQGQINQWREQGIAVEVARYDVADAAQARALIAHIDATMPMLAGLVHAAGGLDDGILMQQYWQRFQTVYAPKFAAWTLHESTLHHALDFFCVFSSLASMLGSPSQSNYAAANAYLDGIVQYRRSLGLPAIAFNWGPWAEGGMAANTTVEARFANDTGIGYISTERGLLAFERWLPRQGQFGVMVIDWPKIANSMGGGVVLPLLSEIAQPVTSADANALAQMAEQFRKALFECSPSERQGLMIEFICERIASLLGYDNGHVIDPRQPLQQLGLDSLMAVELRNVVNTMLGRALPATLLFKYPSVSALTGYLVTEIFVDHEQELAEELGTLQKTTTLTASRSVTPQVNRQNEANVLSADEIEALSDEEAARLLSASLLED